jgi:hypothetical protein
MKTKHLLYWLIALLFLILPGRSSAQTWLYFQDSQDPDLYDFSWMEVYTPSILERAGTDSRRFPVESTIPAQQGMNSLRLHWTSNAGGNWYAIAAGLDWTAKDLTTADTLTFFLRSETGLSKDYLPKVFFEDTYNTKSTFFSISAYASDLQPGVWTQIRMPMDIFLNAGDPMDYTVIKTIGFTQDAADGQDHTLYVDDMRVFKGNGTSPPVSTPQGLTAKGYEGHVFLAWAPNPETNINGYEIYRSADGGQTFARKGIAPADLRMFTDDVRSLGQDLELQYCITALNDINEPSGFSDTVTASTHAFTDEELLDMVQEATFRYFWDFAHPASGMALERNTSGNTVTSGGSGFGVMAILVGIERGWITRDQGVERMIRILNFLQTADRFHGAWPHWLNGNTGKVIPFSTQDNGGDLVETSYMVQGLLAARKYFDLPTAEEQQIRALITQLWEEVEWDWYRKNGSNVLYWHWSPNYGWAMNFQIRGWNECMIVYLLAIASPTHGVPASLWNTGWTAMSYYTNGGSFYGIPLDVGWDYGGPLFFAHYSFLGFDARNKKDQFTNYFINNAHHAQINFKYCVANPKAFTGYGTNCWGLTASDDPDGYLAHEPYGNDNGTISPTAALSSFPYTPAESMDALKHFYRDRGDRLWGNLGFIDAFNLKRNWYATSYLAIDQGPIIDMIENYRTGLLWNLFMANEEIQPALTAIGFVYDSNTSVEENEAGEGHSIYPNPSGDILNINNINKTSKVIITNMLGQQVKVIENPGSGTAQISVDELVKGIYILTVRDGSTINAMKFVKESSYFINR